MHAKPDLRVVLKWMIAGSGSVIAAVISPMKLTRTSVLLLMSSLAFCALVAAWLMDITGEAKINGVSNSNQNARHVKQLIEGLASENKRPSVPSNPLRIRDFYQKPGDWDPVKQREVSRSYFALLGLGKAAFPDLVASINDDRYSHHIVSAGYLSESVGDACNSILSRQIVTYRGGYKTRRTKSGDSVSYCTFNEYVNSEFGGYIGWWDAFEDSDLVEMRVDYVDWAARREDRYGYESPEQELDVKSSLSRARLESQTTRTEFYREPVDAMLRDVGEACELFTKSSAIPRDWPKFFDPLFRCENMPEPDVTDGDIFAFGEGPDEFGGGLDAK